MRVIGSIEDPSIIRAILEHLDLWLARARPPLKIHDPPVCIHGTGNSADPSMPKRVLIEIAQKKQERSMLNAYFKYKAGLNPQKKTPTGGKPTAAQSAFNAMDAVERKINNLDFQTLSSEERESFTIALENLKQTVQNKLDTASQPNRNLL
jgi:hypothetical protein